MKAAVGPNTRKATIEVVSEDKNLTAPFEALDHIDVSNSKGNSLQRCSLSLLLQNKPKKSKTICSALTVLSPKQQAKETLCCIFPGSMMELKPLIDNLFEKN